MTIRPFQQHIPNIGRQVYIDPMALVLGQVTLGDDVSIWPTAIVRGDINAIKIGAATNIQECVSIHVVHAYEFCPTGYPVIIGSEVTLGHGAIIHGCQIGNRCLIGMNATILDGAIIEDNVIIAAHSLVPPNKTIQSGFLYIGNPAKPARKLTEKELQLIQYNAAFYVDLKNKYLSR